MEKGRITQVIGAASKIIGENVDDEKNRRLVDKFLSEEEAKK